MLGFPHLYIQNQTNLVLKPKGFGDPSFEDPHTYIYILYIYIQREIDIYAYVCIHTYIRTYACTYACMYRLILQVFTMLQLSPQRTKTKHRGTARCFTNSCDRAPWFRTTAWRSWAGEALLNILFITYIYIHTSAHIMLI